MSTAYAVSSALKGVEDLSKQIQALEQKNKELLMMKGQTIQPLQQFPRWERKFATPKHNYYGYESKPNVESYQKELAHLDEWFAAYTAVYKDNQEICRANLKIKDYILLSLKELGIKDQVYEAPTKRSYKKKWISAPWVSSISSQIPCVCSDGKYDYENYKRTLNDEMNKLTIEENKLRVESELKVKQQEQTKKLAKLWAKYPEAELEASSILEKILEKNKYLDLAHAMLETRNDWNDGFYKVEGALSRFKVESPLDKDISSIIGELASGEETDGRIFRDCVYGYDHIFSLVKPTSLMDDYNECVELLSKY